MSELHGGPFGEILSIGATPPDCNVEEAVVSRVLTAVEVLLDSSCRIEHRGPDPRRFIGGDTAAEEILSQPVEDLGRDYGGWGPSKRPKQEAGGCADHPTTERRTSLDEPR